MPADDAGWRWRGRFAVMRIVLLAAYSCAVAALAVYGLAYGARTGEWRRLWATLYGAIFTLLLPLTVWLRFGNLGVYTRKAARLRAGRLPEDAGLLPLAADQPALLTPEELAELPRGFVAVRFVGDGAERVWNDVLGTLNTVAMGGLMISLTYVAGYASIPNLFNAYIGPVPVFLLWVGVMLLFYLPLAFLPMFGAFLGHGSVRWDEHGLGYRRGPLALRDTLLPWGRIQAVVRADYRSAGAAGGRHAYVMYTTDGAFMLGVGVPRPSALDVAATEQLLRQIVTKSGLPVREPVAADVMREMPIPRVPLSGRLARAATAATEERLPPEAADRLHATLPTVREERRGRALVRLSFVPALLLVVLYLVGLGMQLFGR